MSSFTSMNLQGIDLNLLLAFDALFAARTVTGAARRLRVGQPATSAALARLRRLFGDELFIRAGGAMQPTPLAIAVAPHVGRALVEAQRAFEIGVSFEPAKAERSFTLASTDYTSFVLLPTILSAVQREAPGVDLRVVSYDKDALAPMLDRGEVDVVFGVFPDPPPSSVVQSLFQERFVGVARRAHPALARGRVSLDAFVRFPHALATMRRDAVGAIDEALAKKRVKRRVGVTVPHHLLLPRLLTGSDLLAALPERLVAGLETTALTVFPLPFPAKPWTVSMMWPEVVRRDHGNAWLRALVVRCTRAAPRAKGDDRRRRNAPADGGRTA